MLHKIFRNTLLLLVLSFPFLKSSGKHVIKGMKVHIKGEKNITISLPNWDQLQNSLEEKIHDYMEMAPIHCDSPRMKHHFETFRQEGQSAKQAYVMAQTKYKCPGVRQYLRGEACKIEKFSSGWEISYCD